MENGNSSPLRNESSPSKTVRDIRHHTDDLAQPPCGRKRGGVINLGIVIEKSHFMKKTTLNIIEHLHAFACDKWRGGKKACALYIVLDPSVFEVHEPRVLFDERVPHALRNHGRNVRNTRLAPDRPRGSWRKLRGLCPTHDLFCGHLCWRKAHVRV